MTELTPSPARAVLYDEIGMVTGSSYVKGQWRLIASHTETEIRGFFGDYQFLSNFQPATVLLDGIAYSCVENAYKAAKYPSDQRAYFLTCTPYRAVAYERDTHAAKMPPSDWDLCKVAVMHGLIAQKFDPKANPVLAQRLLATGSRYLEETNWWHDTFWGVHRTNLTEAGAGQNTLGQLLMTVRESIAP